jgi:prefoldin alpha subunit
MEKTKEIGGNQEENAKEAQEKAVDKRREHLVELRMIDQEIKEIQQQMEALEAQNNEIAAVQQAIDEIKNENKGKEILVPIAGGIFIKALLDDTSKLILNVGAGTTVEKTPEEAKNLLEQQRNEIASIEVNMTQRLHELVDRAVQLQGLLKED